MREATRVSSRRILRCDLCDGLLIEPAWRTPAARTSGLSDSEWDAIHHAIEFHPAEWRRYGIDTIDEIRVAA